MADQVGHDGPSTPLRDRGWYFMALRLRSGAGEGNFQTPLTIRPAEAWTAWLRGGKNSTLTHQLSEYSTMIEDSLFLLLVCVLLN